MLKLLLTEEDYATYYFDIKTFWNEKIKSAVKCFTKKDIQQLLNEIDQILESNNYSETVEGTSPGDKSYNLEHRDKVLELDTQDVYGEHYIEGNTYCSSLLNKPHQVGTHRTSLTPRTKASIEIMNSEGKNEQMMRADTPSYNISLTESIRTLKSKMSNCSAPDIDYQIFCEAKTKSLEFRVPHRHKFDLHSQGSSTSTSAFVEEDSLYHKSSRGERCTVGIMRQKTIESDKQPAPISPLFRYEEELEETNIIYKRQSKETLGTESNNNTKGQIQIQIKIQYMCIDLFLKKIAIEKNFINENMPMINGFIQQHSAFISIDILIEKVFNAFQFLLFLYQNNINMNVNSTADIQDEEFHAVFPKGLIKFLNHLIIATYEEKIKGKEELVNRLKTFYEALEMYHEITEDHDINVANIIDLFENQDSQYDLEFTLMSLKGRKKSSNVTIKIEPRKSKSLSDHFDFNDWSEIELAQQLTLISTNLFSKIEPKELIAARFSKKDKYNTSPNVLNIIDRFDKFSLFLIEEILAYDHKKMRAKLIEKLIAVANECKNLNNFNDCMNIKSALNHYIIKGLKKTWKAIKPDKIEMLNQLIVFCSYEGNYKNMRYEILNCKGKPYVPYLGLLLKDIAFLEEGPKYVKDNRLINMEKIQRVSEVISAFYVFKPQVYLFRVIADLSILANPHPKSEQDLEHLANCIEPVYVLSKVKSPRKRITSTDSKMYRLVPTYQGEYLYKPHLARGSTNIIHIKEDYYK